MGMIDELSGREYYPLSYTAKDLPVPVEGYVATHGRYFPPDARGVRGLVVFVIDDDNDEAMEVRIQRVSKDGQILEDYRNYSSADVDWQSLFILQEQQDRSEALIDESLKKGYIVI
ncbi:uncharacterized protein LOC112350000 [Selaginella moellendorffii]|nr:uncharacterized protein LOC112350000 [Selaginella moellendorffii]|eukprot:XP_024541172.1 uncharacterized protein LOC112350000 [Selaginella moellendorffii]